MMTDAWRPLNTRSSATPSSGSCVQAVRRICARLRWVALLSVVMGASLHAAEAEMAEWLSFLHARGEPAMIGANADHELANTAYRPVPVFAESAINIKKFQLGFLLFHEGRLSSDGRVACVTCHAGPLSGVDGRRVSLGVKNAPGQ